MTIQRDSSFFLYQLLLLLLDFSLWDISRRDLITLESLSMCERGFRFDGVVVSSPSHQPKRAVQLNVARKKRKKGAHVIFSKYSTVNEVNKRSARERGLFVNIPLDYVDILGWMLFLKNNKNENIIFVMQTDGSSVAVRLFDRFDEWHGRRRRNRQRREQRQRRRGLRIQRTNRSGSWSVCRLRRVDYRPFPDSSVRSDVALDLSTLFRLPDGPRQPTFLLRQSRSHLLSSWLHQVRTHTHTHKSYLKYNHNLSTFPRVILFEKSWEKFFVTVTKLLSTKTFFLRQTDTLEWYNKRKKLLKVF
jgi:hypothetical protein